MDETRRVVRWSGRENGQALVLCIIVLTVLLGCAALVIDLAEAYMTKRTLQSSTDAAALAGARELPDSATAISVAGDYSGRPGAKNESANLPAATAAVTTECRSFAPCKPVNTIVVEQSASVPTLFAHIFGIDSINVHTRAVACAPCEPKKVDVMMVLDRTGSMCQDHWGNADPACTDLNNARSGMLTFLSFMDPTLDRVGLVVLPPAPRSGSTCVATDQTAYDDRSARWLVTPLSSDYASKTGSLNNGSSLVSTINCIQGGGRTSYATAIEQASAQLQGSGRSDADHVIVFFSDGAANYGPSYYGNSSSYRVRPCHQGVSSAGAAKGAGIEIYSIGYDLDAVNGGANRCQSYTGSSESPSITAYEALQDMASGPDFFYNKPNAGQLNTIYTNVAVKVLGPRLIE